MDPVILSALVMGSLSLAVTAAKGVLGLVFHVMVFVRPSEDRPAGQ